MLSDQNIKLRALEPEDIDFLYATENDETLWEVSDTTIPYSRHTLKQYLENAHQDLLEAGQFRFVIEVEHQAIGFVDLFDYNSLHHRAGVGIVISSNFRGKGYGTKALEILKEYARRIWNLHQLYAQIGFDNKSSISTFEKAGFIASGLLKSWKFVDNGYKDNVLYQCIL